MACLIFFVAMITSAVCFVTFATGHREIYTNSLRKFDVRCRKLLRLVVDPPTRIDWNQPSHTQYFVHGTGALIKDWNTLGSRYGQQNICPNLQDLQLFETCNLLCSTSSKKLGETYFELGIRRWKAWTVIFRIGHNTNLWIQYYKESVSFVQWWSDDPVLIFSCLISICLTPIAWKGCGLGCPEVKLHSGEGCRKCET